jgi:hypothetical protein
LAERKPGLSLLKSVTSLTYSSDVTTERASSHRVALDSRVFRP